MKKALISIENLKNDTIKNIISTSIICSIIITIIFIMFIVFTNNILAIIILSLLFIYINYSSVQNVKLTIKNYNSIPINEKKNINKELNKILIYRKDAILTDKFFITGCLNIYKYSDIDFICKKISIEKHAITEKLIIITKDGKKYWYYISNNSQKTDFSEVLRIKNKNLLVGLNKNNKNYIKTKYNIDI